MAILVDFEAVGEFKMVIKPVKEPILSDFCKNLTGISQADVEKGFDFNRGIDRFYEWIEQYKNNEKEVILHTWGNYDKILLQRNFRRNRCKNKEFSKIIHKNGIIDLQEKFLETLNLRYFSCSLTEALTIIGETFEGIKHRSTDDARNMLKLYKYLYRS